MAKVCVVTGSGNDGGRQLHTSGMLGNVSYASIDIAVAAGVKNFGLQIWKNYIDSFDVLVYSPSYDLVAYLTEGQIVSGAYYGSTELLGIFQGPSPYNVKQLIYVFFQSETGDIEQGIFGQTYRLLQHADAALVTSGTATLETALFRVPQVVCYHTPIGKVISFLRRHILTVKFISLVNLIADREVVKELVADTMTVKNMQSELEKILEDDKYRSEMLVEYERMAERLGPAGAPRHAARKMLELLKK